MSKCYKRRVSVQGHENYKINIEEYVSASDLAQDCADRTRKDGGWHEPEFGRWSGVESYDEALNLLKNGYKPTVEKLKEHAKIACGNQKRIKFQNATVGFAPVVPLALMGVPNSMIDMRMKPMKTKVMDVYYDMTCSCGTSSDEILANGQKLLGAILEMEAQGYKFNLYCVQTYSDSKDCDMLIVKVKSSHQPLDINRISFPLTHTAFFRVIGFDWYGKSPDTKYRGGYGHAIKYEFGNRTQEFYKKVFGDNAVCFSGTEILHEDQGYIKGVLENESQKR